MTLAQVIPKEWRSQPKGTDSQQPEEQGAQGVWVLHRSDSTCTLPGIPRAATCPVWHVLLSPVQTEPCNPFAWLRKAGLAGDDCQDSSHLTPSTTRTAELQNRFKQPELNQPWQPAMGTSWLPPGHPSPPSQPCQGHGLSSWSGALSSPPPSFQDSLSPPPAAHNVPRPQSAPDRLVGQLLQHLALPSPTSHPESLCKSFGEGSRQPSSPTSNSCERGNLAAL